MALECRQRRMAESRESPIGAEVATTSALRDAHGICADDRVDARPEKTVPTFGNRLAGSTAQGCAADGRPWIITPCSSPPVIRARLVIVGRIVGDGLVGGTAVAAGRCARLRCRHRPPARTFTTVAPKKAARRSRPGEREVMDRSRQCQRLGADERRRGAGYVLTCR